MSEYITDYSTMIEGKGILRYSPKLLGRNPSSPADDSGKWWLVVDCDTEIGRYYRHLINKHYYNCLAIQRPSWKEHITVIRDEEPSNKSLWLAYDKKEVNFKYKPQIESNGDHYWLNVFCSELLDIREELGLPRLPLYPLHLTIGTA